MSPARHFTPLAFYKQHNNHPTHPPTYEKFKHLLGPSEGQQSLYIAAQQSFQEGFYSSSLSLLHTSGYLLVGKLPGAHGNGFVRYTPLCYSPLHLLAKNNPGNGSKGLLRNFFLDTKKRPLRWPSLTTVPGVVFIWPQAQRSE
jgi:hypothetical protein